MKNRLQEGEDTIRDKEHRYHIIEDELVSPILHNENSLFWFTFISLISQARTRLNYEEQISVLTEQVVSLSEQLASCK